MFIIVTTLLCIYLVLVIYKLTFWKRKGVFQLNSWSIFGVLSENLLQRKHMGDKILEICQKNSEKPYFGVYTCFIPTLVLNDVELIKEIAIRNIDSFLEHRIFTLGSKIDVFSKNLFASLGSIWKVTRPSVSPAFSGKKVREMSPLIQECADQALKYIKTKTSTNDIIKVDIKDEISKKYMTDIVASVMFGIESNSFEKNVNQFSKTCDDVCDIGGLRLFSVFGYCFPQMLVKFFKLGLFTEEQAKFFSGVAMQIVESRRNSNIVRPDFIHFLMMAQKGALTNDDYDDDETDLLSNNEDKSVKKSTHKITDEEIVAHTLLIILAGIDTTSCAFDYLMYELAVNMDVQDKLVEEIDEMMENKEVLNANDLNNMAYLEAVVLETLRKWPPLVVTDRVSVVPFTLNHEGKSINLEPGSILWVPIYAIHRNPKYWENPDKFDPSRFSKENIGKINKNAYMPFGIGPRVCLGQRVAIISMKIMMVNILRNYKIVEIDETPDAHVLNKKFIFLTPSKPIILGFQKRYNH